MAINELEQTNYERIKQNIENGATNDIVAREEHLGLRRVRLIRRSKSYKSYLALRAAERRKQAQNTPAKAVGGAHELAHGDDLGDLLINTGKDGEPVDESGKPIVKDVTPQQIGLPTIDEIVKKPRKKKSDAEVFGEVFFWAVIAFALFGFATGVVMLVKLVF